MLLNKDLPVVGYRGVRAQRTRLLSRQFENPRAPRCRGERECPGLVNRVRARSNGGGGSGLTFCRSTLILPLSSAGEQGCVGAAPAMKARAREAGSGPCGERAGPGVLACLFAHLGPGGK